MSRLVTNTNHDDGGQELAATAPLYGRDEELRALRAVLRDASAGHGRLVLIAGEAGIGKTSLVEALAAGARRAGAVVLTGHCYDYEMAPYEPWVELLRTAEADDRLAALSPRLGNPVILEALSGKDALFEEVAGLLHELSAHQPVMLALEDLHWSDQASLELLRSVARRLASWPVLVVATFRDNELAPRQPMHRVLPPLVRENRPLRIDLRPLDDDAIRRLTAERYALSGAAAAQLIDHLQRYAEGNPFYLDELLRTLEHERLVHPTEEGWAVADLTAAPVPPLVRQMIEERVARLGAPLQRMLQMAAVIGQVIPPDLWQEVATASDDAFADAVDQARQAHLVAETADRAALRFSHALVREALYGSIPLPRRRAWHRRIAEIMAGGAVADPDAVAHHLLQAGDPAAAGWLIQAGQRAERRDAAADAIARYEQALPLLEQQGSADALAWLHADLAESYRYIDLARSAVHLDCAEQIARDTDDGTLALAIRWLRARLRGFLGQSALEDLRDCINALDAMSPQERDEMAAMGRLNLPSRGLLAQWIAFLGRYDEATAYAQSVLATDHPASAASGNELGGASIALGLAYAGTGRPAEARSAFATAREQFRAIGGTFMTASALKWELIEVSLAYDADDLAERRRLLEDYAQTMARMTSFAVYHGERPLLQTFRPAIVEGRWEEARESALAYMHVPAWRVSALAALAELERRQGQYAAAWGRINAGLPAGPASAPGGLYFVDELALQRVAADLALDEGRAEVALAWIETHERWLDWSGRVLERAENALLRARYQTLTGEPAAAEALATRALARATEPRQPLALFAAHRLLGMLAIERNAFDEAGKHLDAALTLADACAAPYARALTLLEQARLVAAGGREGEIAPLLAEARDVCARLEAAPALDRIAALEARSAEAPGGLSPREVEVLRLVAQGLSYAEVGDRLFISPRTVARHLQSIYGKLDVDSRAEAAAFAYAHGLV